MGNRQSKIFLFGMMLRLRENSELLYFNKRYVTLLCISDYLCILQILSTNEIRDSVLSNIGEVRLVPALEDALRAAAAGSLTRCCWP